MDTTLLGKEVRRLRLDAGFTLRKLAATLGISAAHLSDIEHNHRRPSEKLLLAITRELRGVGAKIEAFNLLVTGVDPETREWIATTPGVRRLLRAVKESGFRPAEILPLLEARVARTKAVKKRKPKK